MTIREFARLCGVSPATASRFFSGQGQISEEKRALIAKMAKKTGYQPSQSYRTRRRPRSALLVIVPDFEHAFFNNMAELLRAEAAACERQLVAVQSDGTADDALLAMITALAPLGVILLSDHQSESLAGALIRRGIPSVLCGGLSLGRKISAIHIDNMQAAYDGARYLTGLGHKKIGLLSDDTRAISSGFLRITGCRRALAEVGLPLADTQIAYGEMTYDGGYRAMDKLLTQSPDVTAVFAFGDDMAVGAAARLWDGGLRIPDDVSLLGFDDTTIGRQLRPGLSTIRQPREQIARACVAHLLQLEHVQDIETRILPHELLVRDSCRRVER
ncbi:LacI family transcriptional regulator [Butyricicoccus sp. 1XD8-22]|nr:LacI family transcriptional regulator [Butyricicoccus sp. 1XD8-22]